MMEQRSCRCSGCAIAWCSHICEQYDTTDAFQMSPPEIRNSRLLPERSCLNFVRISRHTRERQNCGLNKKMHKVYF